MILIHTALLSEAQAIIEKFKLKKIDSNPKTYANNKILVIISGMGKEKTVNSLNSIFENYKITKAINIGIAGCNDTKIEIGSLFCTNKNLQNIKFMELKTVDKPQIFKNTSSLLYDMEAKYFEEICKKYLDKETIYIFKVISDYLDDRIPSKEFVKKLIQKSLNGWIEYI